VWCVERRLNFYGLGLHHMTTYLAPPPAPRQLDIVADTILSAAGKTPGDLSTGRRIETPGELSTKRKTETPGDLSTKGKTKTPGDLSTSDLKKLDARRRRLGVSIGKLCAAAGIHVDTYDDARAGRSRTRPATFDKLSAALARLAAGEETDDRRTLCQVTLRVVTAYMSIATGWDPELMLSQDFSVERPTPIWLAASRMRRCAIYILVEGGGIGKATIGHAIGVTRAGVHKTVADIEAARMKDGEFDALMQRMMAQLKGYM
jgi:hypothetical protein